MNSERYAPAMCVYRPAVRSGAGDTDPVGRHG